MQNQTNKNDVALTTRVHAIAEIPFPDEDLDDAMGVMSSVKTSFTVVSTSRNSSEITPRTTQPCSK
jgi:hypothetical protein